MKKGLTELVFIPDRNGPMSGLESDNIGGCNAMLEKQKKEPGEAVITTVLFDDKVELQHDRINLCGTAPITEKEYFVRGNTALLDAVGKTIYKNRKRPKTHSRRGTRRTCHVRDHHRWHGKRQPRIHLQKSAQDD